MPLLLQNNKISRKKNDEMVVHTRTLGGCQQGTKKTNFWADTLSMLNYDVHVAEKSFSLDPPTQNSVM